VVLLGARDSDGNTYIVDEHAERNWIPQLHADAIKAMLKRHHLSINERWGINLARFVAGADVFGKQSDGSTVASQYSQLGIPLRRANMDRLNGWAAILKRLGDEKGKIKPTLFFHRRCSRLIDCLPTLQHDPNRPEDVLKTDPDESGIGGDDAADALRYMIATQPQQCYVRKLRGI
jgi:phage terminase large subunit